MMIRRFLSTAVFLSSALSTLGASSAKLDHQRQLEDVEVDDPTLVDIVVSTDFFSTLTTLVVKAELVDALSSEGPFTVFAPTDGAFTALAEAAPTLVNNLATSDSWNEHLTDILLYHVTSGAVTSDIIVPDSCEANYTMLNGEDILVEVADDVAITTTTGSKSLVQDPFDVIASNGVAHTIDSVLLPFWVGFNIIDLGVEDGNFEIVISLLRRTGLDGALTGFGDAGGGLTLFAPLDSAFEGIDASALSDDQVRDILLYHVVPVVAASSALSTGPVPTLQGNDIDVVVSDSGVTVNGISVVGPDALANNGIVHVIDQVLIPPPPVEKCPTLRGRSS